MLSASIIENSTSLTFCRGFFSIFVKIKYFDAANLSYIQLYKFINLPYILTAVTPTVNNSIISSTEVVELPEITSIVPTLGPTEITITEYPNLPSSIPVYISVRFGMSLEAFKTNEQQFKESVADQLSNNYNSTFTNDSVIIINITRSVSGSARATTDEVIVDFYITRDFTSLSVNNTLTRYIGDWLSTLLQDGNDGLLGVEFTGKVSLVIIKVNETVIYFRIEIDPI